VKRHEDSAQHLKNKIDLAVLGTINIALQLSKDYRQLNKYNEKVKINQEILSKIDCIKFSDKFALPRVVMARLCNRQILAFFKDCWNLLESLMNPAKPIS